MLFLSLSGTLVPLVLCIVLQSVTAGYVVTLPRKWVAGSRSQVCLALDSPPEPNDRVTVEVAGNGGAAGDGDGGFLGFPEGPGGILAGLGRTLTALLGGVLGRRLDGRLDGNTTAPLLSCEDFDVPADLGSGYYAPSIRATVTGSIGGVPINETVQVIVINPIEKIFLQTDKKLYKAGQLVQFRALSLGSVYMNVSTEPYPEIFVESPSGARIQQWLDVPNPSGLIHREFQLIDEAEEGTYRIVVKGSGSLGDTIEHFWVEDYVLPRFAVTVSVSYLLPTNKSLELTICAQYTFGQPVRGNASVNVKQITYGSDDKEENYRYELVGCDTFEIPVSLVDINDPAKRVYAVGLKIQVEEADTGIVVEEITGAYIAGSALSFQSPNEQKYAKPHLPFPFYTLVKKQDDQPAVDEPMRACAGDVCGNFTTDEYGRLRVVYLPSPSERSPVLEVTAVNYPDLRYNGTNELYMYGSRITLHTQEYFSPSNSSLFMYPDLPFLNCTHGNSINITLPVLYTSQGVSQATLYVQAVSRGQIQFWKTLEVQFTATELPFDESEILGTIEAPTSNSTIRGAFNLTLNLPPTVSHVVSVLIWYVRPDGEVVSDEQLLEISICLNYPVELSWSTDRAEQGTDLPLTLAAPPNSLCSLGVVDKSVELLSAPQISLIHEIFVIVDESNVRFWERSNAGSIRYCTPTVEEPTTSDELVFGIPINRRNERPSGRLMLSGLLPPLPIPNNIVDAIMMFDQAGLNVLSDQTLETRPCVSLPGFLDEYALLAALSGGPSGGAAGLVSGLLGLTPEASGAGTPTPDGGTRAYFPETWLWELITIPDTGVYSENQTLPDTITEWVGKAVCVHPDLGVGISAPTSITTFTSFFIDLTLPPSIRLGEILPVKISVFNYFNTSVPVRITLKESLEYEILGINGTEAAADQAAAGERSACVPSQDKVTVVVRIRPLAVGPVAINVTAAVDTNYTGPCGSGAVLNKIDRISKPVTVDYEGFAREKTWTKFICSNDSNSTTWNLEAPADIVNNSGRAWITVAGDLLGPTLDNLDHLIRMPYGCGEQNMVTFTPNIYVLQYLQASNQATEEVTQRLLNNMRSGYQRELTYRRFDGSYSCFGDGDASGSTWLTAFVLKSYAQSLPYITVDPNELTITSNFLTNLQLESGCFQNVGTVHNKRMKGGVGASGPGALTAYVMAALLEAGVSPYNQEIINASHCIEAATAPGSAGEEDVYLLALKAYAYSLIGLPPTEIIINDLLNRSTQTSEGIFWDMNSLNGESSEALSVETTSYVLLAMLNAELSDPQGKSLEIVKWISSRRNGQGGFVSTQDTVLALQALATFAGRHDQQPLNLTVMVTGDSLDAQFQVTKNNKLLTQRAEVDVVPNNVTVDLMGSGCALVQAVVRYNVPDPDVSEVFKLQVITSIDYSYGAGRASNIRICATYLLNDGESNMGIIEVNLVSGFAPEIADLDRIVTDVTGSIKRYEVEDGKVFLYLDQFTDSETCVEFTAVHEAEVEDVKPGTVKIYDYYEPDFFVSETYTFSQGFLWG